MPLSQLLNTPVMIISRSPSGDKDEYGNETDAETTIATVGELQQRRRNEPAAEGEVSDAQWDLFLPAGTQIDTGDAVQVDGIEYELVGAPWEARNPRTQTVSHIEATVRRTAGADQ